MSVTAKTLRLTDDLRVRVAAEADQATRQLVEAWARAWDGIEDEMRTAVDDLLAVGEGEWPTRWQINRATRAQKALAAARESLSRLADGTRVTVTDAAGRAVDMTAEATPRIISAQYPLAEQTTLLTGSFDRVSAEALDAIVKRTTRRVTSLTRPLSPEATDAMKRQLVRGVAVGQNPRLAASQMVARVEGAFNGGLNRAMVIARTEILDAHRAGAKAAQNANADVLAGWVWLAQMDKRTCPSCFAQSGQLHPLEEDGPMDHQQGRCARVPQTKSWKDLGFDMPEPASVIPDSRTAFDALPQADRLAVMGPQRLAGLDDGTISWSDLSSRRTTDGWRDSMAPTPLKDLVAH